MTAAQVDPAHQAAIGAGWFPAVEISNRNVLDQLRAAVLAAWEAQR